MAERERRRPKNPNPNPTDFPADFWESILKKLPIRDLLSISLVSKELYSISNTLIFTLRITNSDDLHLLLPHILHRFTSLRSIDFDYKDYDTTRDRSVFQIAHSGLQNLEKLVLNRQKSLPLVGIEALGLNLRSLKILCLSDLKFLNDNDLFVLASSLPWLQELDISFPSSETDGEREVTDKGIAELAANRTLIRIDMSGNKHISDHSLKCLVSSCGSIAEICCADCEGVTVKGVTNAICGANSKFKSLRLSKFKYVRTDSDRCCLHFTSVSEFILEIVSILVSIARANIVLEELILDLGTYPVLNSFILSLLQFLRNVRSIKLNPCCELTDATFYKLVEKCSSLTDLEMVSTRFGKEINLDVGEMNYAIRALKLNFSRYLNDQTLKRIVLGFPNLEVLEVRGCREVTEEGIGFALNNCPLIKSLKVGECGRKKALWVEEDGQVCELKLEVLSIAGTKINNKGMVVIAKRCPHLVSLEMEGCRGVTVKGVKELIGRCKKLREVRLGCDLRSFDSVDISNWTMASYVYRRPGTHLGSISIYLVPLADQKKKNRRPGVDIVCQKLVPKFG